MDDVQAQIVLLELGCLLVLAVPLLAFGGALFARLTPTAVRGARLKGGLLLLAGLLLLFVMYGVLGSAPAFDFVDRCRPDGSGFCRGDKSFAQVEAAIRQELLLVLLRWVGLPLAVGVGGLMLLIRRRGFPW